MYLTREVHFNSILNCYRLNMEEVLDISKRFPSLIPNASCNLWKGVIHLKHEVVPAVMFPSREELNIMCPLYMKDSLVEHFECYKTDQTLNEGDKIIDSQFLSFNVLSIKRILNELKEIGNEQIVACSGNLSEVTLRTFDTRSVEHQIVVKVPSHYPVQGSLLADVDLPEIALHELCQATTILEMYTTFQNLVESFQNFWIMYEELLDQSWVIDPEHRHFKDIHCRIVVGENVSMLLTFNPQDANNCPEIKFLGPENATATIISEVEKNLKNNGWNEGLNIVDNLLCLLNISSFPRPEVETNHTLQQHECSICFTLKLNDQEHPTKVCNNAKCSSYFHVTCLAQWFLAVPTNEASFNLISGDCPSCGERVLCSIKAS